MTIEEMLEYGDVIYISRPLAKKLGLRTALTFAVLKSLANKNHEVTITAEALQKDYIPDVSVSTVRRHLKDLESLKLIQSFQGNLDQFDATKTYRINWAVVESYYKTGESL